MFIRSILQLEEIFDIVSGLLTRLTRYEIDYRFSPNSWISMIFAWRSEEIILEVARISFLGQFSSCCMLDILLFFRWDDESRENVLDFFFSRSLQGHAMYYYHLCGEIKLVCASLA